MATLRPRTSTRLSACASGSDRASPLAGDLRSRAGWPRSTPIDLRRVRADCRGRLPARHVTEIQIWRNEIQIWWNEIQAGWNKIQIPRNEIQIQNTSVLFAESSLFNAVSPVRPGSFVGPSVFVSGSSGLLKQVKGWRRFDRGWRLCETRRRRFRPTCRPRSLIAKKGNLASAEQKLEDWGKTDDRSDVRQKYVRLRSPIRFRA
jgi:hypothetical protein